MRPKLCWVKKPFLFLSKLNLLKTLIKSIFFIFSYFLGSIGVKFKIFMSSGLQLKSLIKSNLFCSVKTTILNAFSTALSIIFFWFKYPPVLSSVKFLYFFISVFQILITKEKLSQ